MEDRKRVVVTGTGAISALGPDVDTLWRRMLAGESGIARIRGFDTEGFRSCCGAEIDGDELAQALEPAAIRRSDPALDYLFVAAYQALKQAGIPTDKPCEPRHIATLIGTGGGPTESIFTTHKNYHEQGRRSVRPTAVPRCMFNALSSNLSMRFRLTGPNYVMVSACASSTIAIGIGFRMIRDGEIAMALCGGTENAIELGMFLAWDKLYAMSPQDDAAIACRPFDADRDGCVLGSGAGALMLESLESARKRDVPILGEICGYGESSDAHHMTKPSPEGQSAAMRSALRSAGMGPSEIGFINAHGTSTRANDECEAASIADTFGEAAAAIPVASSKAYVGHLLGACGALETIVTLRGLNEGRMPANLNLDCPDPSCHLQLVGSEPIAIDATVAMKNSFGFGGNNAVLVVRKWGD